MQPSNDEKIIQGVTNVNEVDYEHDSSNDVLNYYLSQHKKISKRLEMKYMWALPQ